MRQMFKRKLWLVLLVALSLLLTGCTRFGHKPTETTADFTLSTTEAQAEPLTKPAETQEQTKPEETKPAETQAPETQAPETLAPETQGETEAQYLDEDGYYYSKDEVALYIYQYGKLPSNFITKKEAEKLGWSGGSLEKYAPGKAIGGSRFGNNEGLLPEKKGRTYTECDINTLGKSKRGAERIVFSNDGLIYYTGDHYESFELLYGEE